MIKRLLQVLCGALLVSATVFEVQTSFLQSRLFSRFAGAMTWQVGSGPSAYIMYPEAGPYNQRQGFVHIDEFTQRLEQRGYEVSRQARFSPAMLDFVERGGNPPYHEKRRSGLTILDDAGMPQYVSRYPGHTWQSFDDIPSLLVDSLLFIENRDLLDELHPQQNPAVEWPRLGKVLVAHARSLIRPGHEAAGASTLATQLEKFRYSPEGITADAEDKLQQMVSAAVRAYRDGPDTTRARRRIVRDYINSTPLSGRVGFGEVQGIGEGLWAWYGLDLDTTTTLLQAADTDPTPEQAQAFKAALSLVLSQRRPSYYLLEAREELAQLTNSYLRVLGNAGVIGTGLVQQALVQPLIFREGTPSGSAPAFIRQKAVNNVRAQLLAMLDINSLYDLDRLDLTVKTTIASDVQQNVEDVLQQIVDPAFATANGLTGYRLLAEDQLDAVRFSVLIYESTAQGNKLRVQTDNLNMPFDLNDGSKLDLGSTAKLRTLITYLDIVEMLYHRFGKRAAIHHLNPADVANDPLRQWVVAQLRSNPDASLQHLLDAAMQREYSASPAEVFFTAGGQHRFGNFESKDDTRVMTVAEAFNRSVNLPFVRMMRDISRFYVNEIPGIHDVLENPDNPLRQQYLTRFADFEGKEYLQRFYAVYRGLAPDQLVSTLAERTSAVPYRLAMAFRSVQPAADIDAMAAFMALRLGNELPASSELQNLYDKYGKDKFNSNDRAYLAGVHPLELWMVDYLLQNPGTTYDQLVTASVVERQIAYAWLFRTSNRDKQQSRIRILVEQDAFAAIHRQWQRLGYPFPSLVPSYATALGVSADRPIALTELMGIIVNNGYRLPMSEIETLHFAADTPYDTLLQANPGTGERVLSSAISGTVREALMGIVETGTGRRLSGVYTTPDGVPMSVGGKTGTGDHRSRHFGAGGQLLSETVINRNAIFTFFIDDRFFGTILASVGGEKAADFEFTSGLASQLLKVLEPALKPLIYQDRSESRGTAVETVVQAGH